MWLCLRRNLGIFTTRFSESPQPLERIMRRQSLRTGPFPLGLAGGDATSFGLSCQVTGRDSSGEVEPRGAGVVWRWWGWGLVLIPMDDREASRSRAPPWAKPCSSPYGHLRLEVPPAVAGKRAHRFSGRQGSRDSFAICPRLWALNWLLWVTLCPPDSDADIPVPHSSQSLLT